MLWGMPADSMFGRRGESVLSVRPMAIVRSEGGGWLESRLLPGVGASGSASGGLDGAGRGADDVNRSSVNGSGRT
jgi:hypothetical protein